MRFRSFIIFLSALFASAFARVRCVNNRDCFKHVVVENMTSSVENMTSRKSMPLSGVLHDGRVFLIVWASYCRPCVEKISSIPLLQDALKSRGLKTRVVMVSIDSKKENADLKKENAAYGDTNFSLSKVLQLWSDNLSSVMGKVGSRSIPCAFLLNKQGECIRAITELVPEKGGWDCEDVVSQIKYFEQ